MTEIEIQISPDELAIKWSGLLNQAFIRIITLEKQLGFKDQAITNLETIISNLQVELHDTQCDLKDARDQKLNFIESPSK